MKLFVTHKLHGLVIPLKKVYDGIILLYFSKKYKKV